MRTCRIFLQTRMFRSIDFCVLRDACRELLSPLGICFASGTQDAEVTKSLLKTTEIFKKKDHLAGNLIGDRKLLKF